MNRLAVAVLSAAVLLLPAQVLAAGNEYNDPAMSFTAPADCVAMRIPPHDPAVFEQPTIVADFIRHPNQKDATNIGVRMQNFDGTADAFDVTVENDARTQGDGVFIKKTATKLANGMPAYWLDISIGSGFDEVKGYEYLWADGVRGVEVFETGRYGMLDEAQAKRDLANISAVAYPKNRY